MADPDTVTAPCFNCGGNGVCPTCHGTGEWELAAMWRDGLYKLLPGQSPPAHCTSCGGTKKCTVCGGKGRRTLTREHIEPRATADPGYALCPECHGSGYDPYCEGFRVLPNGKRCNYCDDGSCPICHGDGQVPAR